MYYVYWLWLCDRLIHNDVMCDLALAWHRWHCHIWSPINMCGAGLVWVTSVQCQWHPHIHTDDPGHTGPHHGDRTQGQGLPLLLLLLPFIWVSGIIDSGNFSSGGLVAVSVNRHFGWVRKFDFFIGLRLFEMVDTAYVGRNIADIVHRAASVWAAWVGFSVYECACTISAPINLILSLTINKHQTFRRKYWYMASLSDVKWISA